MTEGQFVGLADALSALRNDLQTALAEGDGQRLGFDLEQAVLEFTVVVQKSAEGSAGTHWWLLSADAKGSVSAERTHRLALTLSPIDRRTGGKAQVSDPRSSVPER